MKSQHSRRTFLTAGGAAAALALSPRGAKAQLLPGYRQFITIGVNAPLSGSMMGAGDQLAAGVQAAIDEQNMLNGGFNSAYTIHTYDDQDALAESIMNATFAATDGSIVAVIGGVDGPLTAAAVQTYANENMPFLVAGSTDDAITAQHYRNVFQLPTRDSIEGELFARFLTKKTKTTFALSVTQDAGYGYGAALGFADQMKALHLDADTYVFPYEKPDYTRAAAAIMAKKPDYLYLCGETGALGPIIPALKAAGYTGAFGASQGFYNLETLKSYGGSFSGGYISTSFPPLDLAPDVANALADFKAHHQVTALSAFAYAAAQIVMQAQRRTGATTRLQMLTALQQPIRYDTLVGPFQFGPTGDPIDPNVYFYTVAADGNFKFIAPSHPTNFVL